MEMAISGIFSQIHASTGFDCAPAHISDHVPGYVDLT
jgi:hypothetical protein